MISNVNPRVAQLSIQKKVDGTNRFNWSMYGWSVASKRKGARCDVGDMWECVCMRVVEVLLGGGGSGGVYRVWCCR